MKLKRCGIQNKVRIYYDILMIRKLNSLKCWLPRFAFFFFWIISLLNLNKLSNEIWIYFNKKGANLYKKSIHYSFKSNCKFNLKIRKQSQKFIIIEKSFPLSIQSFQLIKIFLLFRKSRKIFFLKNKYFIKSIFG